MLTTYLKTPAALVRYPMFGVKSPEPAPPARENALFSRLFAWDGPRRSEKCSDNLIRCRPTIS